MRAARLSGVERPDQADRAVDLLLVAHGSRSTATTPALEALCAQVQHRLPGVTVVLAWIELCTPTVADVESRLRAQTVVVPLLLAHGSHLADDMPATGRLTPALGPDPQLTGALVDQASAAGIPAGHPLVLAATGSKDPRGRADVEMQAGWLEQAWDAPVRVGFVTGEPSVEQAVAELTAQTGTRPAVIGYFLAPGRLPTASGAVTRPLAEHPAVADLVAQRYRDLQAPGGIRRTE